MIVGSNHGDGGHAPLRFAEQDATKLSAVLGEIGGLLPGDPQHPAYDYHLAERGELVLTELHHPSEALDLPGGFDRLLLVAMEREQVVAEIGPRSAHCSKKSLRR